MRFFNNKLSRINFLILIGILTYLFTNMSDDNSYIEAISKASPSVINISSKVDTESNLLNEKSSKKIIGSGIIISNDGYIVTNLHVIENIKLIEVDLEDGQVYPANVIGFDERSDLAVVKIKSINPLNPIQVSNSSSVQIGDQVIAIGNAFGLGKTFTSGIISATGRDYGNPYLQLIQTDAAINPGNSGGALINENGNLIGINSKIYSNTGAYQGIGFAIPSNVVVQIATQLIRFGQIKSLWIGNFRVSSITLKINEEITPALRIIEMEKVGPLHQKGIKVNDIIIGINGAESNWNNLTQSLRFATLGENLILDFYTFSDKFKTYEFEYAEEKN